MVQGGESQEMSETIFVEGLYNGHRAWHRGGVGENTGLEGEMEEGGMALN